MASLALVPQEEGDSEDLNTEIGERIYVLIRRRKGMTQLKLAAAAGVTSSVMSKKIKGESTWSASQLLQVARALDVPVGTLFGERSLNATKGDPDGGIALDVRREGLEPPTR
jgi:transcriptional regulator with XRE-family HTH domain